MLDRKILRQMKIGGRIWKERVSRWGVFKKDGQKEAGASSPSLGEEKTPREKDH